MLSYNPSATKCFGVSISYLIIIKKLMPNVVLSLYHDLTSPTTNPPAWALSEHVWLLIFLAILAPLAFLREIHSLRHTSYIALFTVGMSRYYFITSTNLPYQSVPCCNRDHLLFLAPGRNACSWRSQTHPLYSKLRIHFSSPGVRLYMRTECKSSWRRIV
jgi:hypothetical protein